MFPRTFAPPAFPSCQSFEYALLFAHPLGKITITEIGLIMPNISLFKKKRSNYREKLLKAMTCALGKDYVSPMRTKHMDGRLG